MHKQHQGQRDLLKMQREVSADETHADVRASIY